MERTEFEAKSFRKALATVMPAVSRSSTLPILEHVRVRLGGMDACDLNVQITAPLEAHGDDINVCLPADKLRAAAEVASNKIVFEVERGHCIIKAGKSRFKVPCLNGQDFPLIDEAEPDAQVQTTADMHAAIAHVLFSAAVQDIRHYLNGVFLECKGGMIEATATNTGMLATIKVGSHSTAFSTLLHRQTVEILSKAAPGTLYVSRSMIVLESDDARIVAKSIDGQYPAWRRVVPAGLGNKITLPREALLSAVTLSKLTRMKDKKRPIKLKENGDTLSVTAEGMDGGKIETEIDVVGSSGPVSLDVGLDGDLFEPFIKAHAGEHFTLSWGAESPAMMSESGDLRTVVMPMRI